MILMLWLISIVSFAVIQLPPGDFVTSYAHKLQQDGDDVSLGVLAALRDRYGLDKPVYVQYVKWIGKFLRGDLGYSYQHSRPVTEVIGERLALTIVITLTTLLMTYLIAIPIGIYSATHQYSPADYALTVVGFVGLATPNFLLALILMFILLNLGMSAGGLFSPEFAGTPWTIAKVIDLLKHLPLPIVIVGTAGTASIIRVMRASLMDELGKQYVVTARAKGVAENHLLFRYPVKVAINPIISTVGWILPEIVSGSTITALVLSLPTIGPALYSALLVEDMFLAGAIILLLGSLTIIGTIISDFLLVVVDPRIRFDRALEA